MRQDPDAPEPRAARWGGLWTLALATLLLASVFVFGFLPRVSAPPVVTTGRATPRPTTLPRSTSEGEALPDLPAAPTSPAPPSPSSTSSDLSPPGASAARPPRVQRDREPAEPAADVWAAAVSEGQAALDRGSLAEAREAFARAESARPGTPSVRDGLLRLEAALKHASLAEHQRRALQAEAGEDWSGALREYDAAQKIDPVVAFAVLGRARATQRLTLDERLEGYLKRPDRLTTEAVAREAEIALDRAAEVEPVGPRLARQKTALRAALAAAQASVPVRLVSDGLTDVTVLRVGRLGVFKEKTLELRPGTYVVVGTRKGYRDARVVFDVVAGRAAEPLGVRCEEAL